MLSVINLLLADNPFVFFILIYLKQYNNSFEGYHQTFHKPWYCENDLEIILVLFRTSRILIEFDWVLICFLICFTIVSQPEKHSNGYLPQFGLTLQMYIKYACILGEAFIFILPCKISFWQFSWVGEFWKNLFVVSLWKMLKYKWILPVPQI